MRSDFVNRKAEFRFISDWVHTPSEENKGIFVYAKSGIGKSRFVSEFFHLDLPDYIKIKVDILGSDTSAIDSYSFLSHLYRKVIEQTEKNGQLPFQKRISTSADLSIGYIAEVSVSLSLVDKHGYGEQIRQMMSYLTHKLSEKRPYIIDIENFHLVDGESMECFLQLFRTGTQHRFIFEFTMAPEHITPAFYHIFEKVSTVLDCKLYELKKLELKEVHILCERKGLPFGSAEELYKNSDGNLFPLVMLEYLPDKTSLQPLRDILDSLSQDQQLILFLMELAHGTTTTKIMESIFAAGVYILAGSEKYHPAYLRTQYTALEEKRIIIIHENRIQISQDQLLELIVDYRSKPTYYLAWSLYENYHQQAMSQLSIQEREPHVIALLHIYTIFPDMKVYSILPDLTTIVLQQPPEKIIEKICLIRKQLESNEENCRLHDFLVQYLADLCIAVGQWPTALEAVHSCYSEDVPWQACYLAAVMAANPPTPNTEARILQMKQKHEASILHNMSLTVSLLSYYLRTVPERDVSLIAKRYLEEFEGHENLNYAFLLKMYSNTQNNEQAIETLEHANQIFRNYHRDDLIVMNQITIASRNVYMGRIETGKQILIDLEHDIEKQNLPVRAHYILNNKSAISLLAGCANEQTQQDLMTALFSCGSRFEKAIILCNLMIYCIQSKRLSEAKKIFCQIQDLDLSQYHNMDLEFILLKNTWFYHVAQNNEKECRQAEEKLLLFARSNQCPDDIRCHIMSILRPEAFSAPHGNTDEPFFSQFPFQAEFIGYWQFEVCYDAQGKNRLKELIISQGIMSSGS